MTTSAPATAVEPPRLGGDRTGSLEPTNVDVTPLFSTTYSITRARRLPLSIFPAVMTHLSLVRIDASAQVSLRFRAPRANHCKYMRYSAAINSIMIETSASGSESYFGVGNLHRNAS